MKKWRLSERSDSHYTKPAAFLPHCLLLRCAAFPSAPVPAALETGLFLHKLQRRDRGLELLGRGAGVSTHHLDTLHERQAHSLVARQAHHTGGGVWCPLQKCHHCFHTHPAALQKPREQRQSGSGLMSRLGLGSRGTRSSFPLTGLSSMFKDYSQGLTGLYLPIQISPKTP